jgi:hypothetical protein
MKTAVDHLLQHLPGHSPLGERKNQDLEAQRAYRGANRMVPSGGPRACKQKQARLLLQIQRGLTRDVSAVLESLVHHCGCPSTVLVQIAHQAKVQKLSERASNYSIQLPLTRTLLEKT